MPANLKKLTRSSAIALATATALACSALPTTSFAADDLFDPGVTEVEFGTGWYIRGDIGVANESSQTNRSSGGGDTGTELGDDAVSFGFGGGYNFGSGLRGEIGLNHYSGLGVASDTGRYSCGTYERDVVRIVDVVTTTPAVFDPITGALISPAVTNTTQQSVTETETVFDNGNCHTKFQADVAATTFMANAYIDGPEYANITPYVGAGIGAAMVTWNEFKDFDICEGRDSLDCRGQGSGLHIDREGTAESNTGIAPAWSLMIGAGYKVSKNMTLDLGYRYTNIGGTTIAKASDNTFYTEDLETDGFDIHEVRFGLRYEIW